MTMTTIVRVECYEHHMGPYAYFHGSDALTEHEECYPQRAFCYGLGSTPTPEGDRGIMRPMLTGERCAFRDLEQAARWFALRTSEISSYSQARDEWLYQTPNALGRLQLDDAYCLAVYEIDDKHLTVGECQVLAILARGTRICQMSIEALSYLEA